MGLPRLVKQPSKTPLLRNLPRIRRDDATRKPRKKAKPMLILLNLMMLPRNILRMHHRMERIHQQKTLSSLHQEESSKSFPSVTERLSSLSSLRVITKPTHLNLLTISEMRLTRWMAPGRLPRSSIKKVKELQETITEVVVALVEEVVSKVAIEVEVEVEDIRRITPNPKMVPNNHSRRIQEAMLMLTRTMLLEGMRDPLRRRKV
jgi:hypothetical protein